METITHEQKRNALYNYYCTRPSSSLASLIISLMYVKDINREYKQLPKNFKVNKP